MGLDTHRRTRELIPAVDCGLRKDAWSEASPYAALDCFCQARRPGPASGASQSSHALGV